MKLLRLCIVGLGFLAIAGGTAFAQTTSTDSRYSEWQGNQPAGGDIAAFLQQLKGMIDEADKAKAADPLFIQDMRDLIAAYENPFSTVLFADEFKDGNFTANPTWTASAGQWEVDLKGSNVGLRSTIIPPGTQTQQSLTLGNILGAILQPSTGTSQPGTQATYASIYTPVKISNAFKVRLEFVSSEPYGRWDWGPYQGTSGNVAYRVTYFPRGNPGLQLQRVTAQGSTTIASYNQPLALEGKQIHVAEMVRDRNGLITVAIDGKVLLTATDRQITKPFDGFLMINSGGRYTVRNVAIWGTK